MRGERAERKMKRFKERDRQTGRRRRGRESRGGEERGVYLNDGADIWNQTSGIKISAMQLHKNLVVTPCILLVGVKISQRFEVGNVEELLAPLVCRRQLID